MPKEPKRTYRSHSPEERLHAALETIEAFAAQASTGPFSTVQLKNTKEKGLSKIFSLARSLVSQAFSPKADEKSEDADKVRKALDDLQRFHPVISYNASEETEILAKRAQKTISAFNSALELERGKTPGWSSAFMRYLLDSKRKEGQKSCKAKLPFPLKQRVGKTGISKVPARPDPSTPALSEREMDVFRMKAISLIKKHSDLFPSITDTMHSVRESPIYYALAPDRPSEELKTPSVITLEQTLTPFPGETVIVQGSFTVNPGSMTPSMPLSESFELTSESVQTGFPYPSQHNGWALASPLLPPYPMRPELAAPFLELVEKREAVAEGLRSKGELLERSRETLRRKASACQQEAAAFISAQHVLAKSILRCAPKAPAPHVWQENVTRFFQWLSEQKNPLESLSEVHRNINALFIEKPCESLLEAWISQSDKGLYQEDPKERLAAARERLMESVANAEENTRRLDEESPAGAYTRLMGLIFGSASAHIFLQYFSETLECPPPQLSMFEKALQSAALTQQERFIRDLEAPSPPVNLISSIEEDIALFEKDAPAHPLCRVIEKYYTSRYVDSLQD